MSFETRLMINQTTIPNATDYETTSAAAAMNTETFRNIGVTIGIFDIIVGSIGNLLTILAIAGNKKLHKPFHIFIANLCVIDFLTASAMMPFNVTAYYTQAWPFGEDDFTCTFMAYSYYCCGYTSIVCLLVITVNRFVGVVYPDDYNRLFTRRRIFIVLVISWIFAPTFLAPVFFFEEGGYGWNPNQTLCVFLKSEFTQPQLNYMQFIRILFQFLPLLIMIILYARIFITSKQSRRAVTRLSIKSHSGRSSAFRPHYYDPAKSSSSFNHNVTSARMNTQTDTTSLQSSLRDIATNEVTPAKVHAGAPLNEQSNRLINKDDGSIPLHATLQRNRLLSKSDSQLCSPDDSCVVKQEKLSIAAANFHFSHLLSGKSVSVPSSPALGARNKITDGADSFVSMGPSLSVLNKDSSLLNSGSKLSLSLFSRSRCSSRGNRYTTVIKMEEKKRKKIDQRLLRISVTICTTFMILFLPSVIVNLIPNISNPKYHMFASFITWLNSCVNPIVYSFMNANMRKQYKLLFTKFWNATCRCLKIQDHDRYTASHRSYLHSTTSVRHPKEAKL